MTSLSIKTKIRSRLNIIEKNTLRHLHFEKVKKLRENIRKQLDLENDESIETGISKPTIFTRDLFK